MEIGVAALIMQLRGLPCHVVKRYGSKIWLPSALPFPQVANKQWLHYLVIFTLLHMQNTHATVSYKFLPTNNK